MRSIIRSTMSGNSMNPVWIRASAGPVYRPRRDRSTIAKVTAVITPPNDLMVLHVIGARRKLDLAEREQTSE
ncbi:hypothetical protein ACVWZ8_001551 [Arthrobacter sp. UYCu723]